MSNKVNPARGMKDTLPLETIRKNSVVEALESVYLKWGFLPIECPALENIDRLIGSGGGDNEKMVFQVLKRGISQEKLKSTSDVTALVDLGLRYDLTVPLARFYASNAGKLPSRIKVLQSGAVWRAERPQKGRFRQFMQWDADIIGVEEGFPEIELICCTAEALRAIDLSGFRVRINDRRILSELVKSAGVAEDKVDSAFITIDKLDKIGIEGVKSELENRGMPQRSVGLIASKIEPFLSTECIDIQEGLEILGLDVSEDVVSSLYDVYNQVKDHADNWNYQITFDATLVRGMGYYTGQIFEIDYGDYSFSIAGGGRYDGMIGKYLGRDVPACGFSLGFDRILTILEEESRWPRNPTKSLVVLASNEETSSAFSIAQDFRRKGWQVSVDRPDKNTRKQLETFRELGFTHFVRVNNSTIEPKLIG